MVLRSIWGYIALKNDIDLGQALGQYHFFGQYIPILASIPCNNCILTEHTMQ